MLQTPKQDTNLGTIISWYLFEKGQDLQTSPFFVHSKERAPTLVWLLSM